MKTESFALVLDTNCFGDKNKYNFEKSKITICTRSFKDIYNIDVYLPSIVYEELKKHILESINTSKRKIESIYLKNAIDENFIYNIYNKKINELKEFIDKNNIKIINCEDYLDIKEVNEWYFNNKKPFEPSKPKEFPDAMIISAIKSFFKKNKYNNVIVITGDGGFLDGVEIHTTFRKEKDIGKVMTDLLGIKESEIRKCQGYIENSNLLLLEETYNIESNDENDYFEINNIEYDIKDFEIIEKTENDYLVCISCKLYLEGFFELVDPTCSYYDREDPECSIIYYRSGKKLIIDEIDVYFSLYFNEKQKIYKSEIVDINVLNLSNYLNQLELNIF